MGFNHAMPLFLTHIGAVTVVYSCDKKNKQKQTKTNKTAPDDNLMTTIVKVNSASDYTGVQYYPSLSDTEVMLE